MTNGNLTRRQLLLWGSGTAVSLVLGHTAWAQPSVDADSFIALSANLLERKPTALSKRLAASYLAVFQEDSHTDLSRLVGGAQVSALEQQIIHDWYTGLHVNAEGETLVTYEEALMWEALDYTKPMGWCGGETGYWADAPDGEV